MTGIFDGEKLKWNVKLKLKLPGFEKNMSDMRSNLSSPLLWPPMIQCVMLILCLNPSPELIIAAQFSGYIRLSRSPSIYLHAAKPMQMLGVRVKAYWGLLYVDLSSWSPNCLMGKLYRGPIILQSRKRVNHEHHGFKALFEEAATWQRMCGERKCVSQPKN